MQTDLICDWMRSYPSIIPPSCLSVSSIHWKINLVSKVWQWGFLHFLQCTPLSKKSHTLLHFNALPHFHLPFISLQYLLLTVTIHNFNIVSPTLSLSPPLSLLLSAAQDAGLDALAAVISRQKTMGQDIGNELDEQNGTVSFKNPYCWNTHMHTQQKSWNNFCRVVFVIFLQSALLEDSDIWSYFCLNSS